MLPGQVSNGEAAWSPAQLDDTRFISADVAIGALVEADGDPEQAAQGLGVTRGRLLRAVYDDPNGYKTLMQALRTVELFHAMSLMGKMRKQFEDNIEEVEAKDMGRLYMGMLRETTAMTETRDAGGTTINILETVVKSLPPTARDAFQMLVEARQVGDAEVLMLPEANPNYIRAGRDEDEEE